MKQTTRDNLIVIGILAVTVGAASGLVYLPQRKRLRDLQTQIAGQQLALLDSAKKAAAVPDMVRQVREMKTRYGNFDQRLPRQQELGGFLREISGNLSEVESLSNQLIEPGNPTREKLFHTLPINLRFQGSYLSLANFLQRLERMERLTQVERLSITSRGEGPADTVQAVDIEVLMNIYFTES